jgi:hypothetical protein
MYSEFATVREVVFLVHVPSQSGCGRGVSGCRRDIVLRRRSVLIVDGCGSVCCRRILDSRRFGCTMYASPSHASMTRMLSNRVALSSLRCVQLSHDPTLALL